MSEQDAKVSDLVEIAKRNGDFRKNYGLLIGAFLYLRSISAARGRTSWWKRLLFAATGAFAVLHRYGWPSLLSKGPG